MTNKKVKNYDYRVIHYNLIIFFNLQYSIFIKYRVTELHLFFNLRRLNVTIFIK